MEGGDKRDEGGKGRREVRFEREVQYAGRGGKKEERERREIK